MLLDADQSGMLCRERAVDPVVDQLQNTVSGVDLSVS